MCMQFSHRLIHVISSGLGVEESHAPVSPRKLHRKLSCFPQRFHFVCDISFNGTAVVVRVFIDIFICVCYDLTLGPSVPSKSLSDITSKREGNFCPLVVLVLIKSSGLLKSSTELIPMLTECLP